MRTLLGWVWSRIRLVGAVAYYWGWVVARAFIDAVKFVKTDWWKLIIAAIVVFVASGGLAAFEDGKQATQKLEWWGLCVLAELALVVVCLIIFLIRTPLILHEEVVTDLKRIEADVNGLKQAMARQDAGHARTVESLNREMDRVRNSDPHKNAIRHQLEYYISRVENIEERFAQGDLQAHTELVQMQQVAYQYVAKHVPEYGLFHSIHGVSGDVPKHDSPEAEKAKFGMKVLLVRLREILGLVQ